MATVSRVISSQVFNGGYENYIVSEVCSFINEKDKLKIYMGGLWSRDKSFNNFSHKRLPMK